MATVETEGFDEIETVLNLIPESKKKQAKKEFSKSSLAVQKAVSNRVRNGTPLFSRTGQLRRSLRPVSYGETTSGTTLNTVSAFVSAGGPAAKYAPVHEFGATIKAKKAYSRVPGGPYLNIPLPANKTPSGVTRFSARQVFTSGGFLIKTNSGNWIVFSGNGRPMFILRKQVTIPPRLGLRDESNKEARNLIDRLRRLPVVE